MVFLARHGYGHTIAPHEVNYRANLWALKDAGADAVVSVASVGGIRADICAGHARAARPDHRLHLGPRARPTSRAPGVPVNHIDFTEPYSRAAAQAHARRRRRRCGETLLDGGVYAATQGPRLETAAEIDRLERDGADMVGMTGMPEAALARELSLEYAAIAVVANYAAGRGDSARAISLDKIGAVLEEAMGRVRHIIAKLCEQ